MKSQTGLEKQGASNSSFVSSLGSQLSQSSSFSDENGCCCKMSFDSTATIRPPTSGAFSAHEQSHGSSLLVVSSTESKIQTKKSCLKKGVPISNVYADQYDTSTQQQRQELLPSLPPVGEIQIPISPLDNRDTTEELSGNTKQTEDYQTLYFCGQRDLYNLGQKMTHICEENRLLKRRLIELQKELYRNTRSKRRAIDANLAWSIPPSSSNSSNRSSYMTQTEKEPEFQRTLSPCHSKDQSNGRSSPKVQFAPSVQGVPSSVSSEDLTNSPISQGLQEQLK